jgi:hypothetical protein
LNAAGPAVQEWQNRFDKLILSVANDRRCSAVIKEFVQPREPVLAGVFRNGKDVGLDS